MTFHLILFFLIIIVVTMMLCSKTPENFDRFDSPAYQHSCEFRPECLWDTARWIQMSNGMEGVCTLHGLACPAFSKDHDTAKYMGVSPTMVSDAYMEKIHRGRNNVEGFCEGGVCDTDYSGKTALDLLVADYY